MLDGRLSNAFSVGSGVRQGSCLSSVIFNVFVNIFIVELKLLDTGCHIGSVAYLLVVFYMPMILYCYVPHFVVYKK